MTLNCDHKSPYAAAAEMIEHFQDAKVQDALITLRLTGKLIEGKAST